MNTLNSFAVPLCTDQNIKMCNYFAYTKNAQQVSKSQKESAQKSKVILSPLYCIPFHCFPHNKTKDTEND